MAHEQNHHRIRMSGRRSHEDIKRNVYNQQCPFSEGYGNVSDAVEVPDRLRMENLVDGEDAVTTTTMTSVFVWVLGTENFETETRP